MISARGFSRGVKSRQRLVHIISARVDGTGTAALLSGSKELTLTDNGAGDYTLTFAQAFKQIPQVFVQSKTANTYAITVPAVGSVQVLVKQVADGTTATDADFDVMIIGSDAGDAV